MYPHKMTVIGWASPRWDLLGSTTSPELWRRETVRLLVQLLDLGVPYPDARRLALGE